MTDRMKWTKIPQFPRAHYEVDIPWCCLEEQLERWSKHYILTDDPDYQRAHVWTEDQQRAYVEYVLAGGEVARAITWNSPGWSAGDAKTIELVDGKQRLAAVRRFLAGDLAAFGMHHSPDDVLGLAGPSFRFRVCSLVREDVLRLYLNINAGGTPHTADELARVRALLDAERREWAATPRGWGG